MEISEEQLKKISEFVESKLDSLDWQDTLQVRKLALKIGSYEKADLGLAEVSALLHNIGKSKGGDDYVARSEIIARKFLEAEQFNQNFIEETVYNIAVHKFIWHGQEDLVKTLEARVLSDAVLLIAHSPSGFISFVLKHHRELRENFAEVIKAEVLKLDKMSRYFFTKSAKKLAVKEIKKTKDFYQSLL